MQTTHRIAYALIAAPGVLGCSGSDESPGGGCGEIPEIVEQRFAAIRGPLGCQATESLIPDPPGGCSGAEELVASARLEYSQLWADGGCSSQPPSLASHVAGYHRDYASRHAFAEYAITRGPFTVAAREFGSQHRATGPTIVLMHGFPDSQQLYDLVAPALGESHHTITFDFVGWGRSTKPGPDHPFSYAGLLEDLDAVIAHFGLTEVVPVVHDASGWPGIDWALAHPDSVTALVLLNTAYHPIEGQQPPYVIRALSALDLRSQFIDAVLPDQLLIQALFRAQVGRFFTDPARRRTYLPLFQHDILDVRDGLFGLTATLRETIIARAAKVPEMRGFQKPVLVAFGFDDPYLNPAVADAFATVFPNSRLELIEHAGHYVQLDQPERVVELILAALP
jgi:haloalkane dehalogenase